MILERLKNLNIGMEELSKKEPSKFEKLYYQYGLSQQEIDQSDYIPSDANLAKPNQTLSPELTRDKNMKKEDNKTAITRYSQSKCKHIRKKYF
jgi:hypothetical protein